jgi:hypothetical protein
VNPLDLAAKAVLNNGKQVTPFEPTQNEINAMRIVDIVIPEVEFEGVFYRDLVIKVKGYPYETFNTRDDRYTTVRFFVFKN